MWKDRLKTFEIILGSKSPRRKQLLTELGFDFKVEVREIEENYPSTLIPEEVPVYIAREKAKPFQSVIKPGELLITADTVVLLDNEIIGKPRHTDEAKETLRKLSGKTHKVVSGLCITTFATQVVETVVSEVTFDELDEEIIAFYIEHYSPLDKAGAYGIQEWIGYVGIKAIKGSYTNIVGLPTNTLYKMLQSVLN